jgi:hypothetical protein
MTYSVTSTMKNNSRRSLSPLSLTVLLKLHTRINRLLNQLWSNLLQLQRQKLFGKSLPNQFPRTRRQRRKFSMMKAPQEWKKRNTLAQFLLRTTLLP